MLVLSLFPPLSDTSLNYGPAVKSFRRAIFGSATGTKWPASSGKDWDFLLGRLSSNTSWITDILTARGRVRFYA